MFTSITLNFSGDLTVAQEVAAEFASLPPDATENGLSIRWTAPRRSLGLAESTIELLGTIGVLSIPVSIVTGVIANLLTQRLTQARAKTKDKMPEKESNIQHLVILVTFSDGHLSDSTEVALSQSDDDIEVTLADLLAGMNHAEDTPNS